MTTTVLKIKSYELFRLGFQRGKDIQSIITLQDNTKKTKVLIAFVDKKTNLRNVEVITKNGKIEKIHVFMLDEKYQNVVDVLRNEKPLAFTYDSKQKLSYVSTISQEPIGESELVSL